MSIRKGSTAITAVLKGTTAMTKIYRGSTLVYSSAAPDITFVGSKTEGFQTGTTDNRTTSLTNLATEAGGTASLQEGDYVLVAFALGSGLNETMTPPTGWTELTELYQAGSTYNVNLAVFAKHMGAVPDTSVTFPGLPTVNSNGIGVAVMALRGVDATTPLDVALTTAAGTESLKPNPPAITPATAGAKIVVIGAASNPTVLFSNPGDLSAATNHFRSIRGLGGTFNAIVGMGLKLDWTSGAFDPAEFTGGGVATTGSWIGVTLALRPQT
jgi:hypothetical protein